MFHVEPFHCSIKSLRFSPLSSVEYPTATQFDEEVQLTLCRIAPATPGPVGFGLGTIDQEEPFQFSISDPVGFPCPFTPRAAPTAQQSDPLRQEMSKNPPPWSGGTGCVAASVQAVPFQVSTIGA